MKTVRKLCCFFLSVLLIFSIIPVYANAALGNFTTGQTYNGQFKDVSSSNWFYESVKLAYEYGLINGTSASTYDPSSNLSIAQTLAIVCRLHSIYYNGGDGQFTQGKPWYQVYVDYAISNNIIASGTYSDYTASATRAQVAAIFAKALPASELGVLNTIDSISDVPASDPNFESILLLYRAGILTGYTDGTFKPNDPIQRSQMATITVRMILPEQRQQLAFDYLVSLAKKSDINNGWYNYGVSNYTEGNVTKYLQILYNESTPMVRFVVESKQNDISIEYSMVTLYREGTRADARYLAEGDPNDKSSKIDLRATIYPSYFDGNTLTLNDSYTGNNPESDAAKLAQKTTETLKLFEGTVLANHGYSLSDLGFSKLSYIKYYVSLDRTSMTLKPGDSMPLFATVTSSSMNIDASNQEVAWTSSNTSVATVSNTGTVKAVAAGTAIITATVDTGAKAECKVTVIDTPEASAYAYLHDLAETKGRKSNNGSYYYYTYTSKDYQGYVYDYMIYAYDSSISLDLQIQSTDNALFWSYVYINDDLSGPYTAWLNFLPDVDGDERTDAKFSVPLSFSAGNANLQTASIDGSNASADAMASLFTSMLKNTLHVVNEQILAPANYALSDLGFTQFTPTVPAPNPPVPDIQPNTDQNVYDFLSQLAKSKGEAGSNSGDGSFYFYVFDEATKDDWTYGYAVYAYDSQVSFSLIGVADSGKVFQIWLNIPKDSTSPPYNANVVYYPDRDNDSSTNYRMKVSVPANFNGSNATSSSYSGNADFKDTLLSMANQTLGSVLVQGESKVLTPNGYSLKDIGLTGSISASSPPNLDTGSSTPTISAYSYLHNLAETKGRASSDGTYYYYTYKSTTKDNYKYNYVLFAYESQISLDLRLISPENELFWSYIYIEDDLSGPYNTYLSYFADSEAENATAVTRVGLSKTYSGGSLQAEITKGGGVTEETMSTWLANMVQDTLNVLHKEVLSSAGYSLSDIGFSKYTPSSSNLSTYKPLRTDNSTTSNTAYGYLCDYAKENGSYNSNGNYYCYSYLSTSDDSDNSFEYRINAADKWLILDVISTTSGSSAFLANIKFTSDLSAPYEGVLTFYPDGESDGSVTAQFSVPKIFSGENSTLKSIDNSDIDKNTFKSVYDLLLSRILEHINAEVLSSAGYALSDLGFTSFTQVSMTDWSSDGLDACVDRVLDQTDYLPLSERLTDAPGRDFTYPAESAYDWTADESYAYHLKEMP